jgi:hypothetical protein
VLKWRGYKGNQIKNEYSQWVWRQYASAFWDDVRIDRTLGSGASLYSANKADKDEPDEKHMHPLQLDVIERAVVMWSNPGETVLTPFMGVGSEVYGAVINGRRGIGIELKPAYFLKAKFLTRPVVRPDTGELIGRIVRSTTDLSTEEMTDYIERCRAWLLDFFGVMTNDPLPECERTVRKRVVSRPRRRPALPPPDVPEGVAV